jgi:hypothetical protein
VASQQSGDPADPAHVGVAVRAAEPEAGRQVLPYGVAVEDLDWPADRA